MQREVDEVQLNKSPSIATLIWKDFIDCEIRSIVGNTSQFWGPATEICDDSV